MMMVIKREKYKFVVIDSYILSLDLIWSTSLKMWLRDMNLYSIQELT